MKMIAGCSRWTEMQQMIEYHAQLAANIRAPMVFRLLKKPNGTWNHVKVEQHYPSDITIGCNTLNASFKGNTSSDYRDGIPITFQWDQSIELL
jgi:hypothetical protein